MKYSILCPQSNQHFELTTNCLHTALMTAQSLSDRYPLHAFQVWHGTSKEFSFCNSQMTDHACKPAPALTNAP